MNGNGNPGPGGPYQPGGQYQQGNTYQPGGQYQQGNGYQPGGQYQQGNGYQPGGQYQQGNAYQPGGQYQQGNGYQPGGQYQQGNAYQPGGQYQQGNPYQPGGGEMSPAPRKKKWIPWVAGGTVAVAAVALAVVFVPKLFADPYDQVMDAVKALPSSASSPMAEEIGWADLKAAVQEAGYFSGEFSLRELPSTAGIDAALLSGFSVKLDGAVDPAGKQAGLGLALAMGGSDLLSADYYLDEEMAALSIPQLYEGALAISSGNLREQLENSPLFDQMGLTETDLASLDFVLEFFPDGGVSEEFRTALTESLETFQEAIAVEKLDDSEEIDIGGKDQECQGYAVIVPRDAVVALVEDFWDAYWDLLGDMEEILENYQYGMDLDALDAQMDLLAEQLEEALRPELEWEVYLTGSGDLAMVRVDDFTHWLEKEYAQELQDEGSGMSFELTFHGEEMPGDAFVLEMGNPYGDDRIILEKTSEMDGDDLYTEYHLIGSSSTGEWEFLSLETSWLADDQAFSYEVSIPEQELLLFLEGSLGQVEKGESVEVILDSVGMTYMGETLALEGTLELGAGVGDLEEPEEVRMLLEMDEEEFLALQAEMEENLSGLMGILNGGF